MKKKKLNCLSQVELNPSKIKSVIDRGGATCQNSNHFERPTILNAPWDAHSIKQESSDKHTNKHTNKHTDATKRIISPASRSIKILLKKKLLLKLSRLEENGTPLFFYCWFSHYIGRSAIQGINWPCPNFYATSLITSWCFTQERDLSQFSAYSDCSPPVNYLLSTGNIKGKCRQHQSLSNDVECHLWFCVN